MKIRNQAEVCLRENTVQTYDMTIVCLDIDQNSTSIYALFADLEYIFLLFFHYFSYSTLRYNIRLIQGSKIT